MEQAILTLIFISFLISIFLGLLLGSFVYFIFRYFLVKITRPEKIKTLDGFLYLTEKGVYVNKESRDIFILERKYKNANFWIRYHKRMIDKLTESL